MNVKPALMLILLVFIPVYESENMMKIKKAVSEKDFQWLCNNERVKVIKYQKAYDRKQRCNTFTVQYEDNSYEHLLLCVSEIAPNQYR